MTYTATINMEAPRPAIFTDLLRDIIGRVWHFAAEVFYGKQDGRWIDRTFAEIISIHDPMIKRICFGYARTAEELDDLHQDALVNIWQGLPKFRADSSIKTWVYRVTLNSCVSVVRTRKKDTNSDSLDRVVDVIDDDEDRRMHIRELHECIATLNPIDKAIVMLWLDEYSYEEIAEMVGLKRNNVATRLHRAKEKLKRSYQN